MTELLLGIDIGTASAKAVVTTPDGDVVARAAREHRTSMPRPGWVEHDAEHVWWADVVALCRELPLDDVAGVCVSGIGPCVVPCDANDVPLRPAILYGVDTRAHREVESLTAELGADEILQRCGSALSSQALGPKLAWLRANEPDVWERTRRWHMASSFTVARLTGEWVLDHHSASQCDPLYDLERAAWIDDWAEAAAPGLPLPPLAWSSDIVGRVTADAASLTGIPAGTPVVAGTIDAWAEATSVGVRDVGDLMLMYGSTFFLVLVTERPATDPSLWSTRGVTAGSLTLAAGTATAGSLTAWMRDLVDADFEQLTREAARSPPGGHGLLVLPYFAGERTPIMDPNARGTIVGLTLRHERGDLYRAALEGTAYAVRHNLEALPADPPVRAVAVGGGTHEQLWPQIVSDVTGLSQVIPQERIGASYGDALLAAVGTGLVPPGTDWVRVASEVKPGERGAYEALYAHYRALHPATRRIQHALAAIQRAD